nr:hypothetical protein [Tanacetum cinerariifolium]
MDQNIDFFGSDQIQTPQYPEIHPHSQEISDEVFQVKGDLMKSIQTFLEEFNYIPFREKPKILLQAWYKFFIINKELIECNRPTFFDNNEDHFVQYKGNLEHSSNSNQEREGPPQDSDILIHKSSISLKNTSQISPVHAIAPKDPEYSPSMGYEHPNTTPETESDEIIKFGVEELVPILSKNEVTSEDKRECDDIEYVEASLPDPEIVSVEEENVVYHEE